MLTFAGFDLGFSSSSYSATFTTFDAPGAGSQSDQGTTARNINSSGTITGYYTNDNKTYHGFARASNGKFTPIEVPGSVTTYLSGINSAGTIVGYYSEGSGAQEFIRTAYNGKFTPFDIPDAFYALPIAINAAGTILGYYYDGFSNDAAVYLRASNGKATKFAVLGKDVGSTIPMSINSGGAVTGYYTEGTNTDGTSIVHGFLRTSVGRIVTFDAPGNDFGYTIPMSISDSGSITGYYSDATNGNLIRAFLRSSTGKFTTFSFPDPKLLYTIPFAINAAGTIAGEYYDKNWSVHCFVRANNGKFTSFEPSVPYSSVRAFDINSAGSVTGIYTDENGVWHGFLWKP